jgi:branched-chain amino acid transport system permease protein
MIDYSGLLTNGLAQLVGTSVIFFALLAIGLNVHFGYTGLLNFGQIGFALVGGYGMGIAVANFGLPLWAGVLVGIGCGVVLALLLGIPTLRLRADYLAIVTIAASEILRLITRSTSLTDLTGGTQGLTGYGDAFTAANPFGQPRYSFFGVGLPRGELWAICVGWTVVALSVLLVWLLMRSPWGRVLRAIREDEDAARALGKNVFAYKIQSLVLGGVFGALGGIFYSLSVQSLTPDFFSPPQTFFAYAALILGHAVLVLPLGRRRLPAAGDRGRVPADRFHRHPGRGRDPFRPGRSVPRPADGVPPAGDLREQEGGSARCPLTIRRPTPPPRSGSRASTARPLPGPPLPRCPPSPGRPSRTRSS